MNAIEISNLTKTYPDFTLDNITLTLPSGGIMGLVGENGAGKSTLIKLIMNTVSRKNGKVSVLGTDNQSPAFVKTKQDIGVVLDEAYFPEVITPRNVNAIMKRTYTNWNEQKFFDLVSKFRLPETKQFKEFSRGMRMKLAIAAAMSHEAKLLVLDEATSGLDPMVRDEILDIFSGFTRDENHSVLLSSHIVSDLEKICDYIAFLHQGRLIFCEEKDALMEEYALVKMPKAKFADIPFEAVIGKRESEYGVEALVRRPAISSVFPTEHVNLEDIILFIAKGGDRK